MKTIMSVRRRFLIFLKVTAQEMWVDCFVHSCAVHAYFPAESSSRPAFTVCSQFVLLHDIRFRWYNTPRFALPGQTSYSVVGLKGSSIWEETINFADMDNQRPRFLTRRVCTWPIKMQGRAIFFREEPPSQMFFLLHDFSIVASIYARIDLWVLEGISRTKGGSVDCKLAQTKKESKLSKNYKKNQDSLDWDCHAISSYVLRGIFSGDNGFHRDIKRGEYSMKVAEVESENYLFNTMTTEIFSNPEISSIFQLFLDKICQKILFYLIIIYWILKSYFNVPLFYFNSLIHCFYFFLWFIFFLLLLFQAIASECWAIFMLNQDSQVMELKLTSRMIWVGFFIFIFFSFLNSLSSLPSPAALQIIKVYIFQIRKKLIGLFTHSIQPLLVKLDKLIGSLNLCSIEIFQKRNPKPFPHSIHLSSEPLSPSFNNLKWGFFYFLANHCYAGNIKSMYNYGSIFIQIFKCLPSWPSKKEIRKDKIHGQETGHSRMINLRLFNSLLHTGPFLHPLQAFLTPSPHLFSFRINIKHVKLLATQTTQERNACKILNAMHQQKNDLISTCACPDELPSLHQETCTMAGSHQTEVVHLFSQTDNLAQPIDSNSLPYSVLSKRSVCTVFLFFSHYTQYPTIIRQASTFIYIFHLSQHLLILFL
ncbi:putative signal peptide protein [Puccinia sorghi]|uniref:Putative signal peptide protein n=1 Tax=Puccinia sorghi TaxID=27349 RepID=A0A0L6UI76_9BASI|nr:putative signal peptide protein [Puccinia sorghi]